MYDNTKYFKIIISLTGVIILLAMFIFIRPTKTETIEIIKEVPKETIVEVEKEVEVIIEKEIEVEKEVVVEVEPTYIYNITSVERELLARLVYKEANIESLECQKAVASVVINRWLDGRWGDTITDVIYSPGQFSPADLLYKTTPTENNYIAVDTVLRYGCTVPSYVMFFRSKFGFSNVWDGYAEYMKISNTYFGYFLKDAS